MLISILYLFGRHVSFLRRQAFVGNMLACFCSVLWVVATRSGHDGAFCRWKGGRACSLNCPRCDTRVLLGGLACDTWEFFRTSCWGKISHFKKQKTRASTHSSTLLEINTEVYNILRSSIFIYFLSKALCHIYLWSTGVYFFVFFLFFSFLLAHFIYYSIITVIHKRCFF